MERLSTEVSILQGWHYASTTQATVNSKIQRFLARLISSGVAHAMTRNLLWEAMMYEIGMNL